MKELFVAEEPKPTPTLTASDPPAPKKKSNEFSNPVYIIIPAVFGGLLCLYLLWSLYKYFTENRR